MTIQAICGHPGEGKTAYMTTRAFRFHRKHPDRRIVANYPLWLPGGRPVEYIDDIDQCFELRECELLLDEMHSWVDARSWAKRDNKVYSSWISQLRKRQVNLTYTTQAIADVDALIRRRTAYSYYVRSWRALGFFRYDAYFGPEAKKESWFYGGLFLLNPLILGCYDTNFEVGV